MNHAPFGVAPDLLVERDSRNLPHLTHCTIVTPRFERRIDPRVSEARNAMVRRNPITNSFAMEPIGVSTCD